MARNVDKGAGESQAFARRLAAGKVTSSIPRGAGVAAALRRPGVVLLTLFLNLFLFTVPAEADEPHQWRGFELDVPSGWDVAEASYSAGSSGIDSKVFYLRSVSGSRALIVFIDGRERAEALAESSLMKLLDTYLSSHFLRRERPMVQLEPWKCGLGVGDDVPVYGGHAELDPISMGHDAPSDAWACAGRDFGAGLVLIAVGWAEGETAAELVAGGEFPEFREVLSRAGFAGGAEPKPEPTEDTAGDGTD